MIESLRKHKLAVAFGTNFIEVICDSLADINVFEGRNEASAEMAADFLPDLKEATLESKKESRGPPKSQEGKASIDTGGENTNENSSNARILEGRDISTANRSGNDIREHSKNTRTLQGLVGLSNDELRKVDFKAGQSEWLESYKGEFGFVNHSEIQRLRGFLQGFRRKLSETKLKDTDTAGRKLPPFHAGTLSAYHAIMFAKYEKIINQQNITATIQPR